MTDKKEMLANLETEINDMDPKISRVDEVNKSIERELDKLLKDTKNINDAAMKIIKVYDAKSVLVGMRFLQLIQLNNQMAEARAKASKKTDARQIMTPHQIRI